MKPNMSLAELRGLHASIKKYGLNEMPYNDNLSNYTKFMVVRHPMDRLLSSYRDKMRGGDVTFNGYAKSVVQQFREDRTNIDMFPTFQEFISLVLSSLPLAGNPHWSKYFYKCDPCRIEYDYVLKLETMDHDMDMMLSKVFHKELQYITERKLNSFSSAQKVTTNFRHHLRQYENVSKEHIAALVRKFEHESDFFGYSFDEDTLEADCCTAQNSAGEQSRSNCCC